MKVIIDSQEKKNIWFFAESEVRHLKTGDYTIEGYEDILSIERKASTGELAGNITEARWDRELERLNKFKYAYIILEFTADDVMTYPLGSGIPEKIHKKLRVTANFMMSKIMDYYVNYPNIKIIFAGTQGKRIAASIFKRVVENEKDR